MQHDSSTDYLVGQFPSDQRPRRPFSEEAVAFLAALSQKLRGNQRVKKLPDLVAAGFWCRKGHLNQIQTRFGGCEDRLGRGLAFHIAPGNVPVNFIYSFAFGLLAGCANIVRVPSTDTPSQSLLLDVLRDMFRQEEYATIASSNAFVRYDKDGDATRQLSRLCDVRLIWGGDATVEAVRRHSIPARSVELTFPDRYSFAVISEKAIAATPTDKLERLAQGFFNDALLMDQRACSSPHLIAWTEQENGGKERFWEAFAHVMKHQYELTHVHGVDRQERLLSNFLKTANQKLVSENVGSSLLRVFLDKLPKDLTQLRGVNGLFYEAEINSIEELASIVTGKYQTLAYYGIEKYKLSDFVIRNRLTGIDRIVPIGSALDIDTIWDGTDILKSMSRIIDVR